MPDGTKTTQEIEQTGEGLFAWVKQTGSVLAIAAVLGTDEVTGGMASCPEALVAGSLGAFNEGDIAVLLAQIEVAAMTLISKMAPDTEMGEKAFRRVASTARQRMLEAEGLEICNECSE